MKIFVRNSSNALIDRGHERGYLYKMTDKLDRISRRNFLRRSALGMAGLAIMPSFPNPLTSSLNLSDFPDGVWLGRNNVYLPNILRIRSRPSVDASEVRNVQEDEVIPWVREVIGDAPLGRANRKWVETPEGYIYSPSLQKVKNIPNEPVNTLPTWGDQTGMWVEVTVPHVNMELVNPFPQSPWVQEAPKQLWRMYYGQVVWVDEIRTGEDGNLLYRLNELYGSYGDIFWADARAFRMITPEEVEPIHPEAGEKRVVINVNQQTMSCFEGTNEVYFCQVATGRKFDDFGEPKDTWATPPGSHWIWRKLISLHMSGGASGAGWDTMGIGWTSLFVGQGVAIHSTFWHNDFGTPRSHGCVNVPAEDAKWIFRWTTPFVSYFPGDVTDNTYQGTRIEVIDL
jgi:hypothetical protein